MVLFQGLRSFSLSRQKASESYPGPIVVYLNQLSSRFGIAARNRPREIDQIRHIISVAGSCLTQISKGLLITTHPEKQISSLPMSVTVIRREANGLVKSGECALGVFEFIF